MTTPNALVSMIMAMNPTFRTRNDRVAFAVHAFMVANGFKLEAVGDNADKASSAESIRSSERVAEFDTWNASADAYTFLYNPDPWQQGVIEKPMLLKIVSLGDQLLLNWVTLHSAQHEPQQLELEASHYITSKSGLPACYQNIDDLVGKLRSTTHPAEQSAGLKPREAASAKGQLNNAASMRQEAEPDYGAADDEFPKESRRIAQPPSGILGSHDAVPPGFQPPGYGGLQESFPGGMGRTGGMHMGPDDPLFAGRSGMGRSGRPGLNPPGARYDPIGPPGMPGFNPDDFQRRLGQIHPDMAQPGPGRGADWDSMFG
ncbi:hypothetical protein WJX77_011207 [Trebouxia sp. C0004]